MNKSDIIILLNFTPNIYTIMMIDKMVLTKFLLMKPSLAMKPSVLTKLSIFFGWYS